MRQVNIHEAQTRLSELIAAAELGEEVVIARAHQLVAPEENGVLFWRFREGMLRSEILLD
ncbi:MAG: type II toxin-antitoxin system Phd/YefM family antitoxin [Pseudomonadota bacterium]